MVSEIVGAENVLHGRTVKAVAHVHLLDAMGRDIGREDGKENDGQRNQRADDERNVGEGFWQTHGHHPSRIRGSTAA
jgi:hypothetical protein